MIRGFYFLTKIAVAIIYYRALIYCKTFDYINKILIIYYIKVKIIDYNAEAKSAALMSGFYSNE